MTDRDEPVAGAEAADSSEESVATPGHAGQGPHGSQASSEPGGTDEFDFTRLLDEPVTGEVLDEDVTGDGDGDGEQVHPDTRRADEHLADLQRLQAEYVNYKRRVDRDRAVARDTGVAHVVEALLPVLDDIHLARAHGDLAVGSPFAAVAEKLEGVLERFGVTRLGEQGEEFDPAVHEALMHVDAELGEGTTVTTVVQVLQPGYRMGERVVRPARVSVADPK